MVPWPRAHRSHLALLAAAPFVLPTETFSALQLRRLHGGTGRYWLLCTRGLESEAEDLVRQVRQNWREKHRKGTTFWCLDDTWWYTLQVKGRNQGLHLHTVFFCFVFIVVYFCYFCGRHVCVLCVCVCACVELVFGQWSTMSFGHFD